MYVVSVFVLFYFNFHLLKMSWVYMHVFYYPFFRNWPKVYKVPWWGISKALYKYYLSVIQMSNTIRNEVFFTTIHETGAAQKGLGNIHVLRKQVFGVFWPPHPPLSSKVSICCDPPLVLRKVFLIPPPLYKKVMYMVAKLHQVKKVPEKNKALSTLCFW